MSSSSPLPTPAQNVVLDTSKLPAQSSQSVWDRISNWVSENKAVVYTIAGVAVVVTGAGVVYYLSDSKKAGGTPSPSTPKKSKNQRRKEKKKAEEEKKTKAASVQEGMSSSENGDVWNTTDIELVQSLLLRKPRSPWRNFRKLTRRLLDNCQRRFDTQSFGASHLN